MHFVSTQLLWSYGNREKWRRMKPVKATGCVGAARGSLSLVCFGIFACSPHTGNAGFVYSMCSIFFFSVCGYFFQWPASRQGNSKAGCIVIKDRLVEKRTLSCIWTFVWKPAIRGQKLWGSWSQPHLSRGKRWCTPWGGYQSVTGLTRGDSHSHLQPIKATGTALKLMSTFLDCGGKLERTRQNTQTPHRKAPVGWQSLKQDQPLHHAAAAELHLPIK